MFCNTERASQLRLIDFGSGTLDGPDSPLSSANATVNGEGDV